LTPASYRPGFFLAIDNNHGKEKAMKTHLTEPSNAERAVRAERALIAYAIQSDRADELAGAEGMETLITDLLADLMHFMHWMGIDPAACIARAEMHFDAEISEERGRT
jgi:hypothetical protein